LVIYLADTVNGSHKVTAKTVAHWLETFLEDACPILTCIPVTFTVATYQTVKIPLFLWKKVRSTFPSKRRLQKRKKAK